jgi:hypothetical protein
MDASNNQMIEVIVSDLSNNILESNLDKIEGLSQIQKKYVIELFDLVKISVNTLVGDKQLDSNILISTILVETIKLVEKIEIDKHVLLGMDKKKIAISIGSLYLQEKFTENLDILILYNVLAEPLLEQMVNLSKLINVKNNSKKNSLLCCFR